MSSQEQFKILVADEDQQRVDSLLGPLRAEGYQCDTTNEAAQALDMVDKANPKYDWFVLSTGLQYQHVRSGWRGVIFDLRRTDIGLPVLMTGPDNSEVAAEVMDPDYGVFSYLSYEIGNFVDRLLGMTGDNLVLSKDIGDICIVKAGGSSFDEQFAVEEVKRLKHLAELCMADDRPGNVLLTVGGAGFNDLQNDWNRIFAGELWVDQNKDIRAMACLKHNATLMADLFAGGAKYIPSHKFLRVDKEFLEHTVPIMPIAPSPIYRHMGASPMNSDLQTMVTAGFYNAGKVVIVKDTDGVYNRDPLLGSKGRVENWVRAQRDNYRLLNPTARDLLAVDRTGAFDGEGNHLMEDSAIKYWLKYATHLEAVYIVPINPRKFFRDVEQGSLLVPQHIIDPSIPFRSLREHLYAALTGAKDAYRITRE